MSAAAKGRTIVDFVKELWIAACTASCVAGSMDEVASADHHRRRAREREREREIDRDREREIKRKRVKERERERKRER